MNNKAFNEIETILKAAEKYNKLKGGLSAENERMKDYCLKGLEDCRRVYRKIVEICRANKDELAYRNLNDIHWYFGEEGEVSFSFTAYYSSDARLSCVIHKKKGIEDLYYGLDELYLDNVEKKVKEGQLTSEGWIEKCKWVEEAKARLEVMIEALEIASRKYLKRCSGELEQIQLYSNKEYESIKM